MFPAIHAQVYNTACGTPYLREPGVVLLALPSVNLEGMSEFLAGFDPSLNFSEYLLDPIELPPSEKLTKAAGQLCYMSFGRGRTKNESAQGYFDNILSSGHGSVLEHANITFLFYGISRSVTHELVRHRAGFGFSQVSQRYVGGKVLRFVERPEYVEDATLHADFEDWIDRATARYAKRTEKLLALQKENLDILSGEKKTDLRKKVQQAARSCLPNETEAPIVVTANIRGWRHVCEMRANEHAETEIRELFYRVHLCLKEIAPMLFKDHEECVFPDGTRGISAKYRKV